MLSPCLPITGPLTQDNIHACVHMSHTAQAMSDFGARAKHMTNHNSNLLVSGRGSSYLGPLLRSRTHSSCIRRLSWTPSQKHSLHRGHSPEQTQEVQELQRNGTTPGIRVPTRHTHACAPASAYGLVHALGRATTEGSTAASSPCMLHHSHTSPVQSAPRNTSARFPAHGRCMTHYVGNNKGEHDSSPCLNQGACNVMLLHPARRTPEPAAKQVGRRSPTAAQGRQQCAPPHARPTMLTCGGKNCVKHSCGSRKGLEDRG